MEVWWVQFYFSLQILHLQNSGKNLNLTGLQMDEHAWIQRQMWGKGRRNSERGKWNSAVLPVQCCLCLGNFSIAPCSKSHLLVFWFLRFCYPTVSSLGTFFSSPPTWSSVACPHFDVGHLFAWWLPEPQTRHNLFLCQHSSSSGLSFPSSPNTLS